MIVLTRLDGKQLAVNADLIERVEATPNTVLTLVDGGSKYVVQESVSEVIERICLFRAAVLVAANEIEHPAGQGPATIYALPGRPET
jgi:flagellar protein FlbD